MSRLELIHSNENENENEIKNENYIKETNENVPFPFISCVFCETTKELFYLEKKKTIDYERLLKDKENQLEFFKNENENLRFQVDENQNDILLLKKELYFFILLKEELKNLIIESRKKKRENEKFENEFVKLFGSH